MRTVRIRVRFRVKGRANRLSWIGRALVEERWKKMSSEERSQHARNLALTRWSKATEEDREAARKRMEKAREKRWPPRGGKDDDEKTRK
jgi:hypothetical protein